MSEAAYYNQWNFFVFLKIPTQIIEWRKVKPEKAILIVSCLILISSIHNI